MKTYLKDLTPKQIIKRLKKGEVVKVDCNEYQELTHLKMIDGIICRFFNDGSVMIGGGFSIENCYFEEEPLLLKAGKFYKTDHDNKVFIYFIGNDDIARGVLPEQDDRDFYTYDINGKSLEKAGNIISEWED